MQSLYALKIIVSNFCQYRCKYCYVNTTDREVISEKLLYQSIDYYLAQQGEEKIIFFLWWESLLQFDILKKWILRIREKNNTSGVHIFITTSGLSLTQEKLDFFEKYWVKIGISIDGDELTHGLNRVSLTWKNTYFSTLSAIKLINTCYNEQSSWYAMTVDENTVHKTFESFIYLSHLDNKHRNITIAWVYKQGWNTDNISLLESQLEKICKFIYVQIEKWNFYFYNVLSFFIIQLSRWTNLEKWNVEIHVFPDGKRSLHLFSQSILWNTYDDPTEGRFRFVTPIAKAILMKAQTHTLYASYLNELSRRPIL